jgi:hypothetical protein
MSRTELVVLKEWHEEDVSKGFIRQSSAPFAAPVPFGKKPGGELRFCIDYRDINRKTIKNRYLLLLKKESLNLLGKAQIYTKLDVQGAYNVRCVIGGDEYKFAFWTRYRLYEPTVMQFGTTNAPAHFLGYTNYAIREALDDFALADFDDELIYSDSEEGHVRHDKWIMQQLLEAGQYPKPENCEFHQKTLRYLGLIITTKGISMDKEKVETVGNWSREKKTKNGCLNTFFEVQQFLGFCNYYQWFIPKYSEKAEPLTRLTKKDEPFLWELEQQLAFETMITTYKLALAL